MDKWTRFLRAALGYTMTVTYAVDLLPGTCFTVSIGDPNANTVISISLLVIRIRAQMFGSLAT